MQKTLEATREREAQEILTPLKKIAVDFKARELLKSREVMKDSMVFSRAFLVPKEQEKKFDTSVAKLMKECGTRIKFIYIGPIPPFNFVELHLKV